jgi:hypothetical protein
MGSEYENLDSTVVIELIVRAKQTHKPPTQPSISYAPPSNTYNIPPTYGLPPHSAQAQPAQSPDLSSLIAQFGSRPDLQAMLANLQQQQQQGMSNPLLSAASNNPDLTQLLAAATAGQQQQRQPTYAAQPQKPAVPAHIDYASIIAAQQQQQQRGQAVPGATVQQHQGGQERQLKQPDMQELMAQLAKYQR